MSPTLPTSLAAMEGPFQILGWSVIQTLWQAGLVLVIVRLVHHGLGPAAAHARYAAALGGLAVVVLMWAGTMVWLLSDWRVHERCWASPRPEMTVIAEVCRGHGRDVAPAEAAVVTDRRLKRPPGEAARQLALRVGGMTEPLPPSLVVGVTPWLGLLGLGWLLLAPWPLLGVALGLLALARIRRCAVAVKSKRTNFVMRQVGEQLRRGRKSGHSRDPGIRLRRARTVGLKATRRVASPGVIGFWHPVILVPDGVEGRLRTNELKALLAHELAHARSWDYPIGVTQLLVERLLFFNPFVRVLSRLVTREREVLRDRCAVRVSGSAAGYGRMLLTLEGLRPDAPSPRAMLPLRVEGELLHRVRCLMPLPSARRPFPTIAAMWLLAGVTSAFALQMTCATSAAAAWAVMEVDLSDRPAPGVREPRAHVAEPLGNTTAEPESSD